MKTEEYIKLFNFTIDWVKLRFVPFTMDDIREEYIIKNPLPENLKIFGQVIKNLQKTGAIKFNDRFIKSRQKGKKRYIMQWISKEYSERQSNNRISEEKAKSRELEKTQTKIKL